MLTIHFTQLAPTTERQGLSVTIDTEGAITAGCDHTKVYGVLSGIADGNFEGVKVVDGELPKIDSKHSARVVGYKRPDDTKLNLWSMMIRKPREAKNRVVKEPAKARRSGVTRKRG